MGDLQFYIRKEKGGEVSNYLAELPVGAILQVRGPHAGIDLTGDIKEVHFIAGGTGIAPALQVAHTLLTRRNEIEGPKITISWFNRDWDECLGAQLDTTISDEKRNPIVAELEALQREHPNRVELVYCVDEDRKGVQKSGNQGRSFSTSSFPSMLKTMLKGEAQVKYGAVTTRIDSKLIFVSGPEGFVTHFAGPKKWLDGKETQGELGGMFKKTGARDWKVWKL